MKDTTATTAKTTITVKGLLLGGHGSRALARRGSHFACDLHATHRRGRALSNIPPDQVFITALMGSGGSAFAHLAEDADNSVIVADWAFEAHGVGFSTLGPDGWDGTYAFVSPDGHIEAVGDDPASWHLNVNQLGDADARFGVKGSGDVYFGDGTGAPTVVLGLDVDGDLAINGAKIALQP